MQSNVSKKKSFKVTVLQAFSVLIVLIVATSTVIFYIGSSKAILRISDRLTAEVAEKIIERTRMYMEMPAIQTRTIAHLVQQRNIADAHSELWKIMWEQLQVLEQVQAIFIGDEQGNYVQVRRIPSLATRLVDRRKEVPEETWWYRDEHYQIIDIKTKAGNYDPRIRPWYKNTPAEEKITWTDVYLIKSTKTPGISPTYPILDENGQKTGAVSISIPLHRLTDFITRQEVTKNGIIFIINSKNEVIAYPDYQRLVVEDQVDQSLRLITVDELEDAWVKEVYFQNERTGENTINVDGKRYIINIMPFPKSFASEWRIAIVIPEGDLLSSINQMVLYTSIVLLFVFAISFILVYVVAGTVTRPITKLAAETTKIRNFALDEVTGVSSNIKEVDTLNNAILSTVKGLQSFKKYVPADIVNQLISLEQEANTGGEHKELTILFSDVEGFTSLSENMSPDELMLHLSDYLSELSNIIANEKGTIDKYIGDAIMAFWGAPIAVPNSPYLACKAALACLKRLDILNAQWKAEGKKPLPTRFGLHTGNTVVGNLGSNRRINYTAVGDSVNLASRLEGANKLYGTHAIISEDTYQHVHTHFHCRLLDIVAVKGRSRGVHIYELLAEKTEALSTQQTAFCKTYEEGIQHYLKQEWQTALDCFHTLHSDYPADKSIALFIHRCQMLSANPEQLPAQWDGTAILTEK